MVVLVAIRWGLWPSIFTAILGIIAYDFLFINPRFTFITDVISIISLIVFFIIGVTISALIRREQQSTHTAQLGEQQISILQTVMNGAKRSHLAYLDRDFNFVRVNETYGRSYGLSPEEIAGKNFFYLHPDKDYEAIFKSVQDTGKRVEFHDKPFVFPNQPDRGLTYWDWTIEPIKDNVGMVQGLVLSLVDTTERKRFENRLLQRSRE